MKTILVDAVYAFVIKNGDGFIIFKEMHELLESFPNRKILVTSAFGEQFMECGLDKMPYTVFTLKNDPPKSDPRYYELMLKNFNLNAEDVIYFEHNLDAIKSAQSVGITTYYYDEKSKNLEKLKNFLSLNV